jgi:hypothetical protein
LATVAFERIFGQHHLAESFVSGDVQSDEELKSAVPQLGQGLRRAGHYASLGHIVRCIDPDCYIGKENRDGFMKIFLTLEWIALPESYV